jgi:hypothetical protein
MRRNSDDRTAARGNVATKPRASTGFVTVGPAEISMYLTRYHDIKISNFGMPANQRHKTHDRGGNATRSRYLAIRCRST